MTQSYKLNSDILIEMERAEYWTNQSQDVLTDPRLLKVKQSQSDQILLLNSALGYQ